MIVWGIDVEATKAMSLVALLVSGAAFWRNRTTGVTQAKSYDVANCLEIMKRISEDTRRLKAAHLLSPQEVLFEFYETMNTLEALACLYIEDNFRRSTKHIVENHVIEAMVIVENDADLIAACSEALTSPETFKYLGQFCQKHRKRINALKATRLS